MRQDAGLSTTETPSDAIAELVTIRDWLRWGVSRFNEARLVYGHGTADAHDEAAFLILHTLHLPIDRLEPFLDARLTVPEREAVSAILEARITTRKPAPYLTNEAFIQGHSFYVDERVIVPRSYIGELLGDGLAGVVEEPGRVARVLDLCTGSGCLAILAALAFPAARIDAVDISAPALEVARRNVADYGLEGRIALIEGDLWTPLAGRRYDLILANPPYVDAAAMAAFPPEHRHEPALAHAGGADGLDLVRAILASAGQHLEPGGNLVVEIGRGRARLEAERPELDCVWLDTEGSEGEVLWLPASGLAPAPVQRGRLRKGRAR
jgi:ribosomal protein L3 glutamine methyltransferase